ncbi:helix-turn-helix domain-containing protein [Eikenella sp. NML120348]|uniref:helix-turn-helix domain-containing protein n=1 Tax=Eikenella sp. NML120348 TaxID=1795831 RepID=UPI0009EEF27F|nr:helix-turn-helix domain-containing protein [Eikenella sp. NML120348]
MSVKLMSIAWDMSLPMGQKMLLLALCDHANDEGVCYPSQERLAAKCSMALRTVVSHCKWLEQRGILRKERRQNTQRRKTDLYYITLDEYSEPANSACANSACAKSSPERANFAPSERANFAPSYKEEPSETFNHQREPSEVATGINPAAAEPEFQLAEIQTAKPAKPKPKSEPNPDNVATWQAYAGAYRERYGVLPASNAKTRGQTAQLVRFVGRELAPHLAAYFVSHNNRWFVQCRHEIGCLLKSYQQVLTDMQRGEQMTQAKAQQAERTQGNFDAVMQSDDIAAWERYQRKQQGAAA